MDLSTVDRIVKEAVSGGVAPGACYSVGRSSGKVWTKAFGRHTYCSDSVAVRTSTIWDLASVSKVIGTTTGVMMLLEQGLLRLGQPVAEIIPPFGQNGKGAVTLRNLLIHDSGLAAFRGYHQKFTQPGEALEALWQEKLAYPTGTKSVYSDLGMITLGKVIESRTGLPLDWFLRERLFAPLAMKDTLYNPDLERRRRCAPTETIDLWRRELRRLRRLDTPEIQAVERQPDGASWIKGEVHDPNAMVLGGVAGHAGLFSTAPDVAKFVQLMLNKGGKLLRPETVNLFTTRAGADSSRALGWDTPEEGSSAGRRFGPKSFGHTGYTGTSVWADPERDLFAVLLTNRVHPTSENLKIRELRVAFHDAVARAAEAA